MILFYFIWLYFSLFTVWVVSCLFRCLYMARLCAFSRYLMGVSFLFLFLFLFSFWVVFCFVWLQASPPAHPTSFSHCVI